MSRFPHRARETQGVHSIGNQGAGETVIDPLSKLTSNGISEIILFVHLMALEQKNEHSCGHAVGDEDGRPHMQRSSAEEARREMMPPTGPAFAFFRIPFIKRLLL
jgi:hypothetical protein